MPEKRKRRTKAQIAADKAKIDKLSKADGIDKDSRHPNPEIRFLKKNGKPSLLTLAQCLDAQTMKERTYALGYAETFADPEAEEKTKGIDYKGEDAWAIIQRTYL